MKPLRLIAIVFSLLIISLPICFAAELNLIYDANGNLVSGDGKYRTYNSLNQLSKIYNGSDAAGTLLEEYSYHPTEERVYKKKVYNSDASLKETIIYATKTFVKVINSTGTYNFTYIYQNGRLVAQNQDGVKSFIHSDHKGTAVAVSNEAGQLIENTAYEPFGTPETSSQVRFGYEGKEFSSVVGDTDFSFRKMGIAGVPLFQQPDTIIQNVYDPQSLNRYAFERNNPYKYTDPTGHVIPAIIAGILIWGAVLALAPTVYQAVHGDVNLKQTVYGIAEASLDILTTVAEIPYGMVSIGINTYYALEDPKSYLEGKTGYTAAGTIEKLWNDLWKDEKKDECKDDCTYTAEIYTIPNSNMQSEVNVANRVIVSSTQPKQGNNPIYLTGPGGTVTNNVWNYDRIGGVPWVNERTPSGTNVGGGWYKK